MKAYKVDELTRLAFVCAELWQQSLHEANGSEDDLKLAQEFREYRLKRWGKTTFEAEIENATLVQVHPRKP